MENKDKSEIINEIRTSKYSVDVKKLAIKLINMETDRAVSLIKENVNNDNYKKAGTIYLKYIQVDITNTKEYKALETDEQKKNFLSKAISIFLTKK